MRKAVSPHYVNKGGYAVRPERPLAGSDKEAAFSKKNALEASFRTGFHPAAMPGPIWRPGLGWHYPSGEKYGNYARMFQFSFPITRGEIPTGIFSYRLMGVPRYPSERKRKLRPRFMLPAKLVHRLGGMTLRVHVGYDGIANINLDYWFLPTKREIRQMEQREKRMVRDVLWKPPGWPADWREERKMRDLDAHLELWAYGSGELDRAGKPTPRHRLPTLRWDVKETAAERMHAALGDLVHYMAPINRGRVTERANTAYGNTSLGGRFDFSSRGQGNSDLPTVPPVPLHMRSKAIAKRRSEIPIDVYQVWLDRAGWRC